MICLKFLKIFVRDIYLCFINAKFYENYILDSMYFNRPEYLFKIEKKEFIKSKEGLWKNVKEAFVTSTIFSKFLLKNLKEKVGKIKSNEEVKDVEIENSVKNLIKNDEYLKNEFKKESTLDNIIKYISIGKKKLDNSKFLRDFKH